MTSRIVVNNIEADAGVSTVTFGSNISGNFVGSISVSGVTTVAAGSTSAPSITPTGDSNTGIFFPSADTIAFAEGGVEALRIDSNANIGIGTNNPTKLLHLSQNSDVAIRMHSGNCNVDARSWEIVVGGNPSNNAEMVFRTRNDAGTGGTEIARFTTAGNIAFQSGKGIDFSATSNSSGTMTSELLSDYEEGSWTPIASASSGTITSYTSSGRYTKIGRQVVVKFTISISNQGTASGQYLNFSGLPFLASNTWTNIGVCREQTVNGFLSTAQINGNATNGSILRYDNSGVIVNGTFQCTICYDVD
jgi:hypothetical protein